MTIERDPDRLLELFLDEGPEVLPDRVVEGVREDIHRMQQRATFGPWRASTMTMYLRVAAAFATIVVAAAAALYAFGSGPNVGAVRTPDASAPPSEVAETAAPQSSDQVGPPSEAEVTALLNGFLEARVAGEAAQQYLNVPEADVPLLYATTSGAPYERGDFEPVSGTEWPYGFRAFKVRLFAQDTVVEQLFFVPHDDPDHFPEGGRLRLEYQPDGFGTDIAPTTEDGEPVATRYSAFNGEVTVQVGHPWVYYDYSPGPLFSRLIPEGPGVMPTTDGGERSDWDELFVMADPAWVPTDCDTGFDPVNAEALAGSIQSDPGIEATDPVAVSVGGVEGLMIDVKIGAGATVCAPTTGGGDLSANAVLRPVFDPSEITVVEDGVVTGAATGEWMRLYLFDLPEGSSIQLLAIAIVAPESRFDSVVQAAEPVVNSVQVHAP